MWIAICSRGPDWKTSSTVRQFFLLEKHPSGRLQYTGLHSAPVKAIKWIQFFKKKCWMSSIEWKMFLFSVLLWMSMHFYECFTNDFIVNINIVIVTPKFVWSVTTMLICRIDRLISLYRIFIYELMYIHKHLLWSSPWFDRTQRCF